MRNWLPDLPMPRLMREVEIAVYLGHNSRDPADYFFLFDFEELVARSENGNFVRPALRIFAGRDDFSRTAFARMRSELTSGNGKRGWLDWKFVGSSAVDMIRGLVANLVLATALSIGRRAFSSFPLPKMLSGRAPEAKLADKIDETKSRVEAALARVDVTIHPELYAHAYRDGYKGRISGMDRDAWPLPSYVRTHLGRGESIAWW